VKESGQTSLPKPDFLALDTSLLFSSRSPHGRRVYSKVDRKLRRKKSSNPAGAGRHSAPHSLPRNALSPNARKLGNSKFRYQRPKETLASRRDRRKNFMLAMSIVAAMLKGSIEPSSKPKRSPRMSFRRKKPQEAQRKASKPRESPISEENCRPGISPQLWNGRAIEATKNRPPVPIQKSVGHLAIPKPVADHSGPPESVADGESTFKVLCCLCWGAAGL